MAEGYVGSTRKRKRLLVHGGYAYTIDKAGKDGVEYWRCERRKDCKGRCKTVDGEVVKTVNDHTHEPDATREAAERARQTIRERAAQTVEPTHAVVTSVTNTLSADEISSLPATSSLKKAVQRERLHAGNVPPNPRNLEELIIPDEFKVTKTGEQFLLFDSGAAEDRILLFATERNLELLASTDDWYADGTFKTVPKLFGQLYTIHAQIQGQAFPLVFALLPNKQRVTYDRLLAALAETRDDLQPAAVLTDFEKAAIQALQHGFPGVAVTGCLFHLSQNIYKHVQEYGLQVEYSQNGDFSLAVRMISALAFCPEADVVESWELLKDSFPGANPDGEQRLKEYFEHYYIGDLNADGTRRTPLFPIPMWNVHERVLRNEPRSNNCPEAWHRRFNAAVMCYHPTLWKFLEVLQSEQRAVEVEMARLDAGASAPPRKKKYVAIDRRIVTLVNSYEARGRLSFLRGVACNLKQY